MSSVVTERHDKKAQAGVLRLSADGAIRVSATRDDENGDDEDEDEDEDEDDDEEDDVTRANEIQQTGFKAEWQSGVRRSIHIHGRRYGDVLSPSMAF